MNARRLFVPIFVLIPDDQIVAGLNILLRRLREPAFISVQGRHVKHAWRCCCKRNREQQNPSFPSRCETIEHIHKIAHILSLER